jgi:hypothetical protein
MAVDNDHARSEHPRQGSTPASHVWTRQLNSQANRTEKRRSHDERGSLAAGRARKSLSLSGPFRNSSMEKPAETDMLQDSVVRPITGFPARRTYC